MNQYNNQNRLVYTYHLPYAARKAICNLLDADQSWKTLGGQFVGLDSTNLTLIGQAYFRNGSPTEELLNKLDSANVSIAIFFHYLSQMNHCRALEILKPYLNNQQADNNCSTAREAPKVSSKSTTLVTPTPSFADLNHAAIMDSPQSGDEFAYSMDLNHWSQAPTNVAIHKEQEQTLPVVACHRTRPLPPQLIAPVSPIAPSTNRDHDPGEEIVRMACKNNRKRTSISDQEVVNQLRLIMQINYTELKQASNNFADENILGNGGFASVYQGNWKGTDVAIKRLKCNLMDQALNELTILNSYRIDNILPIYGISIDGPEACLVYQFMSNGSLEDRLSCKKNTPPLTWNQRALIGEGVAKGLYYLHTLRDKPLVHGDVKSANVLLDSQFAPKLGDFGLARQVFKGQNPQSELYTHCTVSSIHGTSVYLPPEYLRHKILSPAVDVYSYGIVLLEMGTGRRAYDGKRLLIDLVEEETRSLSQGQIGYSLKDSRLAGDTQTDLKIWFELLIKLGLNCAHRIKKKRPDMGQVLNRFVDFRNNSSLDSMDVTNQNSAYGSEGKLITMTTTRTLTPNPEQTIDLSRDKFIKPANAVGGNHWVLMSVEEETELQKEVDHIEKQQEQANEKHESAERVEAMIPLLTELGIVGEHQD